MVFENFKNIADKNIVAPTIATPTAKEKIDDKAKKLLTVKSLSDKVFLFGIAILAVILILKVFKLG